MVWGFGVRVLGSVFGVGLGFQGYGLCDKGLEDVVWGVSDLFGVRALYIITIY